MTLSEILTLAEAHLKDDGIAMRSSAETAFRDAKIVAGYAPTQARQRALRSLIYSVGIFHPDYKAAAA